MKTVFSLLTFTLMVSAQPTTPGTIQDDTGAAGPASRIVVTRIPEVIAKAPIRSLKPATVSSIRYDREIPIAAGRKDFVIAGPPDGQYYICAVADEAGFVGSCDFSKPADSIFDIKNGQIQSKRLALTLRRGTVVEIVVDDPKGFISNVGFHFRPSVMGPTGEYRVAQVSSRLPGQLIYSATIPRDMVASVLVDSRLRVTDRSTGMVFRKGDSPSSLVVKGGPAKVRVQLAVSLLDQDLSSVKR